MTFTTRIGAMTITHIDETHFDLPSDVLFPDWPPHLPSEPVTLQTHLWVVERDGRLFVVDTGIGNGKSRTFSALFD